MITYLADPKSLASEALTIEGDAYRHLFRSRRLAQGAELRVVDGSGRARRGIVETISRTSAEVSLGDPLPSNEPDLYLELLVGALRPERADFLVEKATELGVSAIRFLRTERTPRKYGEGRLERLARVAGSAVEQCHRSRRPEVTLHDWADVDGMLASLAVGPGRAGTVYLLAPGGETLQPQNPRRLERHTEQRVAVLVGPEGGFTEVEVEHLRELGAVAVDLGGRILRVETAALAAAAKLLLP